LVAAEREALKLTKEIEKIVHTVPKAEKKSSEARHRRSTLTRIARACRGVHDCRRAREASAISPRLKQTVEKVMANRDVLGVRIALAGRSRWRRNVRNEEIKRGRVPLQTLRADIDFAREQAYLSYGVIGIKVWIYRGDIFDKKENEQINFMLAPKKLNIASGRRGAGAQLAAPYLKRVASL
jgi:hypothetical protein